MSNPFKTLEERIRRLERAHRRHQFRRVVKVGIAIATALLILWLLQDALHAWTLFNEMRQQVANDANVINGLQQQVSSLAQNVNGLTVKINGMAVQTPTQTATVVPNVTLAPSMGLLGGLLGMLTRLLPLAAM